MSIATFLAPLSTFIQSGMLSVAAAPAGAAPGAAAVDSVAAAPPCAGALLAAFRSPPHPTRSAPARASSPNLYPILLPAFLIRILRPAPDPGPHAQTRWRYPGATVRR